MRLRVSLGLGVVAVAWLLAPVAILSAQVPPVPAYRASKPGEVVKQAPIYVVLLATIDDEINAPVSMERLPRAIKAVERLRAGAAASHPVCLLQFNGVVAGRLESENRATHGVDTIKDLVGRGLVEIGYDGTDEPTLITRPRPNLRGADTPEKRWLARGQARSGS